VRWDAPEAYGTACKRVDCRDYRSPFNSRERFAAALGEVIARVRAPHLIVSFSDEGFISEDALRTMLASRGHVAVLTRPYRRYVGAQIGIYNPRGERVGRVGKLRNREHLFVCSKSPIDAQALQALQAPVPA